MVMARSAWLSSAYWTCRVDAVLRFDWSFVSDVRIVQCVKGGTPDQPPTFAPVTSRRRPRP